MNKKIISIKNNDDSLWLELQANKETLSILNQVFDLANGSDIEEIEENIYEKVGYMSEAFVKKEYRNKSISTKLKDRFLEFLKEKGISVCRLDVSPNNPAQEAYKKWGFKIDKYRMSLKI